MKYLKSFNNSYNESSQSTNEMYFELVDILQSKVFDDFGVFPAEFNGSIRSFLHTSSHRFWLYNVVGSFGQSELRYPKDVGGFIISGIIIYNIPEYYTDRFSNLLDNLCGLVEDSTGKKLVYNFFISHNNCNNCTIKLEKFF